VVNGSIPDGFERKIADPAIVNYRMLRGHLDRGTLGTSCIGANGLSLTVFGPSFATKPLQGCAMIDDWTETIPADRETTGVSFNFNRPNAVAPHAVLVAVPPSCEQLEWMTGRLGKRSAKLGKVAGGGD